MKIIQSSFAVLCICIPVLHIHSQSLEDLKAPSMPAATIIGTQVNEVSRPKSMKALEASVLNNFLDSSNKFILPNSYALEFNPYMLGKRTNFNYLNYLDGSFSPWKTLSLSVASTNNFTLNDSLSSNALGFGISTLLYNGEVNEKLKNTYIDAYGVLKDVIGKEADLSTIIGAYLLKVDANNPFSLDNLEKFIVDSEPFNTREAKVKISSLIKELTSDKTPVDATNVKQKLVSLYKKRTQDAIDKFDRLINSVHTERYGLRIELDGSVAVTFPTNEFEYSIVPKFGFWTNISYTPCKKVDEYKEARHFSFVFLGRWMNYNDDFYNRYPPTDTSRLETGSIVDLGLRGIVEYKKFSAELEFIGRLNQNWEYITVNGNEYSRRISNDTYKFVLNLNYNIMDNIVLSYNIGKNYESITKVGGNLISGFTVNFGFGGPKKKDFTSQDK